VELHPVVNTVGDGQESSFMRRMQACIALSILCFACAAPDHPPEISRSGCDVALRYAKDFAANAGIPVAIRNSFDTTNAPWPTDKEIDAALRKRPDFIGDPEVEFLRKSRIFQYVSVIKTCPNMLDWHGNESISHSDGEYDKLLKAASSSWPDEAYVMPNAFLDMSAPVISEDGKGIYFHVAEWERTGGGRFAIAYRKNADGEWVLASKEGTGGVP
jgi:hypothetical protein